MTTTRCSPRLLAATLVLGLGLTACGGSDEASDTAETADTADAAESADTAETADALESAAADDGVSGVGSNDELEEVFEEAGVDLDLDDLEDTVAGYSTGEGGGTFTIDGQPYEFAAEACFVFEGDISIEGPGAGPNGEPFWASVSVADTTRDEMEEFGLSDAQLDPMFGDEDVLVDVDFGVEFGRTEMFGSGPDDQPLYNASILLGSIALGEIDYAIDGGNVTASGLMIDSHGVVLEWDETVPFDLVAGCS